MARQHRPGDTNTGYRTDSKLVQYAAQNTSTQPIRDPLNPDGAQVQPGYWYVAEKPVQFNRIGPVSGGTEYVFTNGVDIGLEIRYRRQAAARGPPANPGRQATDTGIDRWAAPRARPGSIRESSSSSAATVRRIWSGVWLAVMKNRSRAARSSTAG